MYTKVATQKLELDLQAAERHGYGLGVKLVRGAYMRAAEEGYPDPIHDTLNDTHESYHGAIRLLLNRLRVAQDKTGEPVTEGNSPLSVVIASHNRESVMFACKELLDHNISFQCGVVYFGQLYGMCDSISYTLSAYGVPVFKYLPFGHIEQVMPYLIRRAQENAAILDRTTTECEIIKDELKHRLLGTHSSGEKNPGLI
ncbi:hypothetical protein INT43_008249 [Umbelopsis isabellina]|uniref:Proline dehydrogenase n=1 Tax=Mortierella isabellina TaxID=91625 RepID=A0A8H7PCS1_MORIS|nr:hypothetical protein INT43_008249 [Umbelopsis isabellina]